MKSVTKMTGSKGDSIRNERVLYISIWTIAALLPLTLEFWEYINNSAFDWHPVVRWWKGMIPLAAIFLLHNHILMPHLLKKGRLLYYAISVCAALLTFGVFSYNVDNERYDHREVRYAPPPPPHPDEPAVRPPKPFREPSGHFVPERRPHFILPLPLLFRILLALLTIGLNVAISLAFSYKREQDDRKELEKFKLQEELKYLKQQISPHFFMNVLNNIHEMADEDVSKSQEMIIELSQLMRYVLYESENGSTDLASESRFISSYVGLMKMRYLEDIVKVNLELPNETSQNLRVPPLLFISFIENAFKHGVSYLNDTEINIKLYEMNGKVMFCCDNTVPQNVAESNKAGGVGLSNVRRRLDLLYGSDYSLKIYEEDQRYCVTLIIPGI